MPPTQLGPLELLIFQGTPFCNIDCKYCYLPDRLDKGRMSLDIVRKTIANLVEDDLIRDDFSVLWHAGEPLVMPIEYYVEAIQLIRNTVASEYHITFSFQTNGTLINDRWCQFFATHSAQVGLSIDGPEFIHDRNRITRSGKGTHARAVEGARFMKQHGQKLDLISVLTAFSCDYPEKMYTFFRELGAHSVSFNVEEIVGLNTRSSLADGEVSKDKVRSFMDIFFRLNLQDGEPLRIRDYDWAASALTGADLDPKGLMFSQVSGPFRTVTVSKEGFFSTFSPELNGQKSARYGDFILGNVLNDSFTGSSVSSKFKLMYADLANGLKKCRKNCEYYGLCPGGTPSAKFSEHQSFDADETMYCKLALQTPIDTLLAIANEETTVTR